MLLTLLKGESAPVDPPVDPPSSVSTVANCWGVSWGNSWGVSWGGVASVREVEIDFKSARRQPRSKNEISPKVRKLIKRIARQAVITPVLETPPQVETETEETAQEYAQDLIQAPVFDYWEQALAEQLRQQEIAWNAFYADLLRKQIDAQITAQIRRLFEVTGVYRDIEDEENALLMMMMEL